MAKVTFERCVTVAVLIFGIGVGWQRMDGRQDAIDKANHFIDTTLPAEYVRKDVYDINQQHLTEAINRLTEQLEKIYELEQKTGEPSRIQRMFDK